MADLRKRITFLLKNNKEDLLDVYFEHVLTQLDVHQSKYNIEIYMWDGCQANPTLTKKITELYKEKIRKFTEDGTQDSSPTHTKIPSSWAKYNVTVDLSKSDNAKPSGFSNYIIDVGAAIIDEHNGNVLKVSLINSVTSPFSDFLFYNHTYIAKLIVDMIYKVKLEFSPQLN